MASTNEKIRLLANSLHGTLSVEATKNLRTQLLECVEELEDDILDCGHKVYPILIIILSMYSENMDDCLYGQTHLIVYNLRIH